MEQRDAVLNTLQDIKQELLGIALILMGGFLMLPAVFGGLLTCWIGVIILFFFGFLQVWLGSRARDFKQ
ncbi:MAG: hypothetical protein HFG00_04810 [Oscillibacter sp.]|nr:hypothetical protein [Oscillibacter sp.]